MAEGDDKKPTPYTGTIVDVPVGGGGNKPAPYTGPIVEATAAKENPEGETIASMDTSKAQGFSQGTPLEAARDLIHGKRWDEVLKAFSPSTIFAAIAPLSTGNPRARQEIIVQQVPGAKAVDDKNGNPMIELEGKRYYTAGGDVDVARAGAAVAGTLPLVLAAPASVPGAALLAGGSMAGQSLAEDAVARAAGGKSQEIDAGKAIISGIAGILMPLGVGEVALPLAGRLYAAVKSGVPLTDKALQSLGLTADQISSLTPELRQTIESVGRRTFGDSQAVGSTYRGGVLKEQGIVPGQPGGPTRGEITGDPGQIAREQKLAGPGNAEAQATILNNRTAQDANLNQAQERLRTEASGGLPPQSQIEATQKLKGNFEVARDASQANVSARYKVAEDPAAIVAAGGAPNAPVTHVQQVGSTVRSNLATIPQGQAVLEDAGLTSNATQALAAIDKFAQNAGRGPAGPRNALDWETVENMRKRLNLYRDAAFGAGGTPTDQAAMKAIIDGFDQHFTSLNPLLADARAAHAEHMSIFKPGGSPDQDRATKTALQLLGGPEEGAKVANSIFADANKGDAIKLLDHLQTKVFPNQPEALGVLKDQALRRLSVDADGKALTPQQQATAIAKALDGDNQGPLYEKIFQGTDVVASLRRRLEAMTMLGKSRTMINPPGSGLLSMATLKALGATGGGAAIGEHIGQMFGMPGLGAGTGATVGAVGSQIIPRVQAARAVNPPANYGVQGLLGKPAMVGGLAAGQAVQQNPGPADRLMQNAYGLLTP